MTAAITAGLAQSPRRLSEAARLPIDEVYEQLESSERGLTSDAAEFVKARFTRRRAGLVATGSFRSSAAFVMSADTPTGSHTTSGARVRRKPPAGTVAHIR